MTEPTGSSLQLADALQWRYATKQFDPLRTISAADWNQLQQALLFSPSSYGLQPWKFIVVTSPALKQQLPAVCWGQNQPRDCSHFVVLAARRSVDAAFVQQYLQRIADIRSVPVSTLDGLGAAILGKTSRMGDQQLAWTARQCYIALGFLLQAAAVLRIDACPMEGIQSDRLDPLLGLSGSEYTSVVACALGYRHAADRAALDAKVRFDAADVVSSL